MYKQKLQIVNPHGDLNLSKTNGEDDLAEWSVTLVLVSRFVACIIVIALIMMVILMILKYLGELDSERTGEDARTQTNLLPATKTASSFTYGTMCDQHDCSTSYSNTSYNYSEDLYDKKLCIICYDEERNSFFVPCGHCATCYDCAKRIFNVENKACPVCRRFIGKVRKLFAP